MSKRILAIVLASTFPVMALAQVYDGRSGIPGIFTWFGIMLGVALPSIIALAIVWFVYNVFRYMIAGDEEQKIKAKTDIVWGIAGIFVMVSVWGLVNVLKSTFNLGSNSAINAPVININR